MSREFIESRPHAACRDADQDVAGPSSGAAPLSDLHLGAVKEVVREMLGARNWTGSGTVAALQARMSMAGHNLADDLLIKAGTSPTRSSVFLSLCSTC